MILRSSRLHDHVLCSLTMCGHLTTAAAETPVVPAAGDISYRLIGGMHHHVCPLLYSMPCQRLQKLVAVHPEYFLGNISGNPLRPALQIQG